MGEGGTWAGNSKFLAPASVRTCIRETSAVQFQEHLTMLLPYPAIQCRVTYNAELSVYLGGAFIVLPNLLINLLDLAHVVI